MSALPSPTPPPARTAVVTGAGRGIGAAITAGLAARSYRLALLGRTEAPLRAVAASLPPGTEAHVVVADLVEADQVRSAAAAVQAALGRVDLLVQNAGVIEQREADFLADDVEDVWRVVTADLRGPMLLAHALLPGMLAAGGGRVVHLNSGSGYRGGTAYTGYFVAKGALARFTTQLDTQYRARGLLVFDLAPGVVATRMTAAMPVHDTRTEWTPPEAVADLVAEIGAGELDALAGRFLRAGADTAASLRARTPQILAADARRLTLSLWGPDDPLR